MRTLRAMEREQKAKERLTEEIRGLLRRQGELLEASERECQQIDDAWGKQLRLIGELMELHDQERRWIGYEIHDGLPQQLAGAALRFEAFRAAHASDDSREWEAFESGRKLLAEALAETRRFIDDLRHRALNATGLAAAIESLVRDNEARGGQQIEYEHSLQGAQLPALLERTAIRIVQEALANARRHSRSQRVRVQLMLTEERLRITVQDWGVGFDPAQIPADRAGLEGIRERARLLGGLATIESTPGKGTCISVEFPVPKVVL